MNQSVVRSGRVAEVSAGSTVSERPFAASCSNLKEFPAGSDQKSAIPRAVFTAPVRAPAAFLTPQTIGLMAQFNSGRAIDEGISTHPCSASHRC